MRRTIICTAVGLLVIPLATPGAAAADTPEVTTSADSGPGSLRQLIADAAYGDTILIGSRDIALTSGKLSVSPGKALTIAGAGARSTSISGSRAYRIIETDAALTLRDLTLRDGKVFYDGGAVWTTGPLTLIDTALVDNTSTTFTGGAVYATSSSVTISRSLFKNNSAGSNGGALSLGANTLVTVQNSTFAGNAAANDGGALSVSYSAPTTVALVNDTFVNNRAQAGDGHGPVFQTSVGQTVSYRNSLFAHNGDACEEVAGGSAISNGHNVFDGTPNAACHLI
jgi:hypothetical protein